MYQSRQSNLRLQKARKTRLHQRPATTRVAPQNCEALLLKKMLLGEAMKKFGRDFKAVVAFMTKHSEVLGGELQEYYRKTAGHGDGNLKAKIERVRKIAQKTLDTTR